MTDTIIVALISSVVPLIGTIVTCIATSKKTEQRIQTVYDALNSGQKKKILKAEKVKALFERYGVEV